MPGSFHKLLAVFIAGASGLALALEAVRLYQEVTRLGDRWNAYTRDSLQNYDATWTTGSLFIPSTDVPTHPAAIAFTPLWRIITIITLFLTFLASIPNWYRPTFILGGWIIIFNRFISVTYVGAVHLYIATSILGTLVVFPNGPNLSVDEDAVTWARYVAGWLLLGAALIDILVGITLGPYARVARGQIPLLPGRPPWMGPVLPRLAV